LSNVDVSMDVSPQGLEWKGNFDLPPTSTFDSNSLPQKTALITASATPFCFCAMQKYLTI
jgi:hypothetical protein